MTSQSELDPLLTEQDVSVLFRCSMLPSTIEWKPTVPIYCRCPLRRTVYGYLHLFEMYCVVHLRVSWLLDCAMQTPWDLAGEAADVESAALVHSRSILERHPACTVKDLLSSHPDEVLKRLQKDGVIKLGEFSVSSDVALSAFRGKALLTLGREDREVDDIMWKAELKRKALKNIPKGEYQMKCFIDFPSSTCTARLSSFDCRCHRH